MAQTDAQANAPLLVELLVEELPPKTLEALGKAFGAGLKQGLVQRDFVDADARVQVFSTPRRLAAYFMSVRSESLPREVPSQKLMPVEVAFDQSGKPTPALIKKIRTRYHDAVDIDWVLRDRLVVEEDHGKQVVKHRAELAAPASLMVGLEGALEETLAQLPIAKVMQYQLADGWTSVRFVRPAHGLVALHGSDIVAIRVLGLDARRTTFGHRFEAMHTPISLGSAASYESQLRDEGAVIADFDERRAEIAHQLRAASDAQGLMPIDDDALLDEVTALVERPNVLTCRFDSGFLDVPPECLVLTMKANQKYFPLLDGTGKLTNRFLVVSNITPADATRVIEGNERVVRPRLADAKFFFDQDRRKSLASRVPALDQVVYHGKLGSQGERVGRVRVIARWVAERIGADPDLADRAALLAKADLLTDMVGEFPELQGVMGGYYAAHDGEAAEVVEAIRSQYLNRRGAADDEVAPNLVGAALMIADRAETLVGMWSLGLKPTGDKDPYALRRHALTLIRSFELVAGGRTLDVGGLLERTAESFSPVVQAGVISEIETFIYERYLHQLAALFDARAVEAVIRQRPRLEEVVLRVQAVRAFLQLPEAPALAAAYKRVTNILRKSSEAPSSGVVRDALLVEPAERSLASALAEAGARADAAYEAGRYAESLQRLAALKLHVDAFFDSVMVNAEDPALRANRLALLASLRSTMNRVADLSLLAA